MLKIGFFVFITLTFLLSFDFSIRESKLEKFWAIYSKWASDNLEYECNVTPEMQIVHSRYRLWQIKQESGRVESILKMTGDVPMSHESYVFMDDCGRRAIYFPEINRTALFCPDKNLDSSLEANSFVISTLLGNLKLVKKFLIFEELSETDEGIIFDMRVDIKKMKAAGLVPELVDANQVRLIFPLKKSGELVRMSRKFDDGDLEVLYFDYVSFSSDEVRESFPKIKNRSSRSIALGFTYNDALDEIKWVRKHTEVIDNK